MRAILLFLILIQTRGKIIQTCPKHCTCKPGAQAEWLRVKCNELENIKDINIDTISVELIQLDLSKNNIHAIETNIFKNFTNLKRLNLSQNDITFIGESYFNGLENLERLDLSKNKISTIDVYAFKRLSNLKRIDLSSNNISTVKPSLFHNLLVLERLKLNNNRLTTLKEGTFYGLKSLKQLDLSNNPWKCDCELYWFSSWIHNSSIKLSPAPKCAMPLNIKGQFIKVLKYSKNIQCQWLTPTIELRPIHNQVVFVGDSITLKCRAPSIMEDKDVRLSWLWYPNTTSEAASLDAFVDPQKGLSNIKIDNRYLADSGIVDSSLSIVPVKKEHNGQWNCLLVSINGNMSKAISVIVISDETRYCPLAVTKNNKGIYTWPKTVVGWRAELPCEGNHLLSLMQMPLKASYQCNITGYWEDLNTELCPYISHTTKSLELFSKVNLSLSKISLMEAVKKFKNYTGNSIQITDPIEINFITQTIENYLNFLIEEKELGFMLIDVISTLINVPKNILKKAEIFFKSCTRLIKAVEKIVKFTPSVQFYKKNMALEEFKVKHDSFTGLICTWYSNVNSEIRFLQCTTNNRKSPINIKDKVIEASIHLPASLLQYLQEIPTYQLMISVYSNDKLFPTIINSEKMDIASCVIGSKLYGMSVQNLTEPVYIMLKVPSYHYAGKKLLPVVWDETLNKSGAWTSNGCQLGNVLNNLVVFHCNRLGYYGLLQDSSSFDQDGNSIIGAKFRYSNPAIYIGSIATITCLIIMSITYIVCYTSITMPKKAKHCVINTWFAIALLLFFYSIGIYQTENVLICQGVGLILHYLSLCSLLWMAVFASNMYKKISKSDLEDIPDNEFQDQPISKPLLGLYLVGWGIAIIICGISGAINLREYAGYSYCFLTSGPALAALFLPAGILILYLIISHLLIKCAIQNVINTQLSEGTQATENMDLELLEPSTNLSVDKNSACSAQTVLSDIEDLEHSQIMQLKGQSIMLILYLISWTAAAATTTKPLSEYIPFNESMFAILYSFFSSSFGIFIFFFYGIARNDVKSQWLEIRCWFRKRKNRCCRTRSISDANPAVIPTQSLVQNLVPVISNSEATQVTSDSNSINSSRHTHRLQACNAFKFTDITNREVLPVGRKMTNVNLVILHRQQYRCDNSVTTYTEPTCVEMFYNPHQSGVARKFFKKQRRHTKNSDFGPRKQGDGIVASDTGSCVSVPRSSIKLETNIDQTILSNFAKVNNTNIHVELNPINDIKNINIFSDSGDSISEERSVPMRFVIGQEDIFRNVKKVNNNCRLHDSINVVPNSSRNSGQKVELLNSILQDSDIDIKIDEEKQLQSVSQQCSLEYSSEIESTTQLTSEKSDHNSSLCRDHISSLVYEDVETITKTNFLKKDHQSVNEFHEMKEQSDTTSRWLTHSSSMYCFPIDTTKPLKSNYCNSLNDISSLTSLKNCEYLKSFTDLESITSLCDKSSLSQKSFDKLELPLSKINSVTADNLHSLVQTTIYVNPSINTECTSNVCTNQYRHKKKFVNSVTDIKTLDLNNEVESINKEQNIQHIELSKTHLNNPNTHLQIVKKETSV